jgi:ABC-type sugar transport system permease subunit
MGLASTMAMALFAMIMAVTLIQLRLLRRDWEY